MEPLQCKYDYRQPAGHFHRASEGEFICFRCRFSRNVLVKEFPFPHGDRNGLKGSRRWALGTTQLCQEGGWRKNGHCSSELGSGASKQGPWSKLILGPVCGVWPENMGIPEPVFCCCVMPTGVRKAGVGGLPTITRSQGCPCTAALLLDSPISPACWGPPDQHFLLGFIPTCKATYGQKNINCSALCCRSQRPKYFFSSGNF